MEAMWSIAARITVGCGRVAGDMVARVATFLSASCKAAATSAVMFMPATRSKRGK